LVCGDFGKKTAQRQPNESEDGIVKTKGDYQMKSHRPVGATDAGKQPTKGNVIYSIFVHLSYEYHNIINTSFFHQKSTLA
jgi:hypothetical protein